MKAIRVHEYGGPSVLQYEDVPRPQPAPDEALVDVRAAGVNPIDWLVREGYADEALDPSLPHIPGWDLAGVVSDVGVDVDAVAAGDEVFGLVCLPDPGETYAEYATAPASELVSIPQTLEHTQAAGVPMVALTAWQALFEAGQLDATDRVLVHAAAGGVGHLAVQLATHAGAHVVGTASGSNEAYLRDLGVDGFIDYREQSFESEIDDVDLVLDAVGGDTLERSIDVLTDGGRIVTLPEPPSPATVSRARERRAARVEWFSVEPDPATLGTIRELIDDGAVRPTISDTWPLGQARTAHEVSQAGHVRGKLVLTVGE